MKENQGGTWTVRLTNIGNQKTSFHGWIERDDFGQSNFGVAHHAGFTLGSISCSKNAITVGSFDATVTGSPISNFSSEGPTRDLRNKPEISAPGSKVVAARSETFTGTVAKSGTSMASPAVTGCIALLFAHARKLGKSIDVAQLRKLIEKSGQSNPPAAIWDSRYGNGRISITRMIQQLASTPASPPTASTGPTLVPRAKPATKPAIRKKAAKPVAKPIARKKASRRGKKTTGKR